MGIEKDYHNSLNSFLDHLDLLMANNDQRGDILSAGLFETNFIQEIQDFSQPGVSLHFGKTLNDLKCVILDENRDVKWTIWMEHIGPKKIQIKITDLPQSKIQERVYRSINELIDTFQEHVQKMSNYIDILHQIDTQLNVKEPKEPTLKDNYRTIELADNIRLSFEVSSEGLAKNLKLFGPYPQAVEKLLEAWDHDENIVSNISKIISSLDCGQDQGHSNKEEISPTCGICLLDEFPGDKRVPQPLCRNPKCGAYFHTFCLRVKLAYFEGLSKFGECPSCHQYIQCN